MSIIIAVVVIVVLLAVVAVVALPRLRGRSLARGRRPVARREPVVAAETAEVEREDRRRPRRERTLIAEGEAIREHVEARLASERAAGARPIGPDPLREGDEIAWQREQEERRRHPSSYGDAAYGPAAAGQVPAYGDPAYGDPAYGGAAYGGAAYGDPAVVPPRGRPVLSARDQLAWQLEQDQRARYPEEYPPSRPGMVEPVGGGVEPGILPVSDALELQLQEIAVRSRGRVSPAVRPAAVGRRPARFGRSRRRVAEDPDDPRLAG
jgi:hypothetical protein